MFINKIQVVPHNLGRFIIRELFYFILHIIKGSADRYEMEIFFLINMIDFIGTNKVETVKTVDELKIAL